MMQQLTATFSVPAATEQDAIEFVHLFMADIPGIESLEIKKADNSVELPAINHQGKHHIHPDHAR